MYSAISILSAVFHRHRTGKGQWIDTSLTDAGLGYTVWQASQFFPSGEPPVPKGTKHEISAPYQAFRCADGYIIIGGTSQLNWERMCRAIGRADLLERPEYSTPRDRGNNEDALALELEEALTKGSRDDWLDRLREVKVPCGPIHDMAEAFDHPQIQAREMAVEVDHPVAGPMRVLALPQKMSETPVRVSRPAPLLGQHTDEVLRELGKNEEDIWALRKSGGVG
jgi:formyl-CoA transferase